MTTARKEILLKGGAEYHCISRCVRRAYLCGFDVLSGKNFDHRKDWVRERLIFLTKIFSIEVLAYALMSNHQHSLLRTRLDLLGELSDEEVARRWLTLYPPPVETGVLLEKEYVKTLSQNKERISILRDRLGSVSWFMKSLNEYIARKANKEDDCKGRFWEGRFKCQRLDDIGAVLACSIYIDLNPVRAKAAKTPEESEFTSAYERIKALRKSEREDLWLAPVRHTKNRKGFLPISLQEYLALLDSTGRELIHGKRGAIPANLEPILERIGINSRYWLITARHYGRWFSHVAGGQEVLLKAARKLGKNWLKGVRAARLAFS